LHAKAFSVQYDVEVEVDVNVDVGAGVHEMSCSWRTRN